MAEPSSFFTGGGGGRSWRDPQPASGGEEHPRRRTSGPGSEMMMAMATTASAAVGYDDPPHPPPCLLPPSPAGRRRPSLRAPAPFSPRSPAGGGSGARLFCDPRAEEERRYFLDACALCRKPLGANCDIFMYRGDVPFCSEECRQEQIDMDEARERGAMKASSARKASSSSEQQGIRVPAAGAIVAG